MKRGTKGNGSVSKLPNGKWLVKVPVGKHANGGSRYRSRTCATKAEAHRWHRSLLAQRENQSLVAGPRQTLRQFATEVLLDANDRIADRTRDGYFRNLRVHVFPDLGSHVLSDIKSQELERLFSRIRRTHSASTVNNVRTALSKVFSVAMRHELVLFNPVARTQKAKRGEYDKTQVRLPWSKEEILQVLAVAAGTPMEAFMTISLGTGMRRGEVLGLRWGDIDFQHQTVSIERTIHRESILQADGSRISAVKVAPPKTASSRRVNQLASPILDVLRRHQMEQEVARQMAGAMWVEQDYVFTNDHGGPLDESNFYKRYKRFLQQNGVRHIRIHDQRHTFATVLIEENSGQLAAVSKALGHSSIGVTMDLYASTARVETQATSRMSEIMFPDRGKVTPIEVRAPRRVASIPPGRRRAT
jgi:integrase